MTFVIEYWPPLRLIALPPNVHASVGSVDDTVTNLMIIFLDAASTVTLGSSAMLGFTVALAPAAAGAAAALDYVTLTTGSVIYLVKGYYRIQQNTFFYACKFIHEKRPGSWTTVTSL